MYWGYAREAASLREAPPSRSLPKSGWRLTWGLLHRWFRLRGGASPISMVTCWRWGNDPLRPPMAGTSPFRGGFAGNGAKRLPRQREQSAVRLTEDKPFCWETHSCGGKSISSTIRCRGWSPSFCGRRRGVAAKPPQVTVSCPTGTRWWLSDHPRHPFGPPLIDLYRD